MLFRSAVSPSNTDTHSVSQTQTPLLLCYTMTKRSLLFHSMRTVAVLVTVTVTDSIFLTFFPVSNEQEKTIPFASKHRSMTLLVRSEVPQGHRPSFCEYCIYNLLTKQWLTLPHLPCSLRNNMVGFICDLCSCDKKQGCFTNAYYRYKVVLIHSPTETNLHS